MKKVKYESRWSEVSTDGRTEYEHLWRVSVNGGKSFTRETWCRVVAEGSKWLYCSKSTHRFFGIDTRYWDRTMWRTQKFTPVKGVNKTNKKHLFVYSYRRKSL